ncbi:MAG TPA: hypothetical protein VGL53_12885, partial [Bryobacteraceae bacterium]
MMTTFDLDDVKVWGPRLNDELQISEFAAVVDQIRSVDLQDGEVRLRDLFSIIPQEHFVRTVSSWIEKQTVTAYHGSRLDDIELQSVRSWGLKVLSPTSRQETLIKKFAPHPDWALREAYLMDALDKAAGRSAVGKVHVTLSYWHLLALHDVVQKGSEFDRKVEFEVFGKGSEEAPLVGQ